MKKYDGEGSADGVAGRCTGDAEALPAMRTDAMRNTNDRI
jgi:hypothetical protein